MNTDFTQNKTKRRRQLTPWWVKISIWYFIVISSILLLIPALNPLKIFGEVELDYFGLHTNDPFSLTALFIYGIALLTGFTALALWQGKKWAVKLALFQGIFCLLLVVFTLILNGPQILVFRNIVYLLLIPYLLIMVKIKNEWEAL